MNILAADDERIILNELKNELSKVFSGGNIQGFMDPAEALDWARELEASGDSLDYAFLDIRMSGMTGLELAKKLKEIHPQTVLIFCTAYTEYAFDAVGMFAKGYLLKPVSAEQIVRTLDEMVYDWRKSGKTSAPEVRMQTFGHFEVFVNEQPLMFEREKAKELLAYLVDRHGACITTEQIATALWEDRVYDRTTKNYVTTICSSLRKTLKAVGAENILIKSRNHLAVDIEKIKCDAYDYEKRDAAAMNSFKGEYMVNYSWAEVTAGKYVDMEQNAPR